MDSGLHRPSYTKQIQVTKTMEPQNKGMTIDIQLSELREKEIREEALRVSRNGDDFSYFIFGAKWADKTMIDKACRWIKEEISNYVSYDGEIDKELLTDFKKAMEE